MMKALVIIVFLLISWSNLLAQYNPSCSNLPSPQPTTSYSNNNTVINYNFRKEFLSCEDLSLNAYAGFTFRAQYSVSNLQGLKEIFNLKIGSDILLRFWMRDQKIEVDRDVVYRPCNSWSGGECQTFGTIQHGDMEYTTWDDQFLESTTGWIDVKLVDNGMTIKVSNAQNGPYKTEFNYEGLHLSGVDQKLADNSATNLTLNIPQSSISGITLTNILFNAGTFPPVERVVIDNGSKSPETNFPTGGAPTASPFSLVDFMEVEPFAEELKLYPNPAQDQVTLTLPEREGRAGIYFYQESGQVAKYYVVDDPSLKEATISTATYTKGLYIVRVIADNKVQQKKLIIN